MMKRIDYFIPTRIVFGAGRLKELATLSLPGKKALLCVTEDKLMEKLGIQQRVIELLGQNGVSVAVFDKVTPNPTRTGVMAAAALAKESGCDFVIGLGGGSSIDTAKAASIMHGQPRRPVGLRLRRKRRAQLAGFRRVPRGGDLHRRRDGHRSRPLCRCDQ